MAAAGGGGASVNVIGLKETQRALAKLDPELRATIRASAKHAANIVAENARSRAPRRSGALAGSIRTGVTATGSYVQVGSSGRAKLYAGVIHFGWPKHNIKANPFLTDAREATRSEVVTYFETYIARVLEGHG